MDEIAAMSREQLESYVRTLEKLDEDRDRLLDALPECPSHGRCVPYALAWIAKAAKSVTLDDDEIPRMSSEQVASVAEAFDTISR